MQCLSSCGQINSWFLVEAGGDHIWIFPFHGFVRDELFLDGSIRGLLNRRMQTGVRVPKQNCATSRASRN